MIDVVAFGELLIDFAFLDQDEKGYPVMKANPGGAPANFLGAVSKYGLKAGMIAKVGDDSFGHLLINTLKENDIDTRGIVTDDRYFTTLAFVTIGKDGEREFSFSRKPGADTQLSYEEVNLSLIDEAKVFHFGTLSLTDEPSKSCTKKLVDYALSKNKLISFDPNLRIPLWKDLGKAKEAMEYGLGKAHIVKISDEEVKFLYDINAEDACEYLLDKYPNIKLIYVTCGKDGAYVSNRKIKGYGEALKDIEAVDTTGAGDIFGGAAMYQLLASEKKSEDLDYEDLNGIISFASTAAGLSVTKLGGLSSIPDMDEVLLNI